MNKIRLGCWLLAALLGAALANPSSAQIVGRFHMQEPVVEPLQGLNQRIQNGEIHLKLADFLTLVLANNTQVHIMRLAGVTAQAAVLAAHSPFDPSLNASFGSTRALQPQVSQTSGAATLSQLSQNTSINYNQLFATGQQLQVGFGSNRNSSNSQFSTFNPSLGADMTFALTQPLWRNRGNLQNRTSLLVAQTQVLVVSDQTQTQIADELVSAANQYWNTVQARDQIRVQQQALDLAQKSYDRDQNALKLGALAPGDIFTSQAQVAQDQTQLLQAQSNYRQQLDVLRRLIGADIDPAARAASLVLDDDPSATVPAPPAQPVEQAVAEALTHRPEMDAIQREQLQDRFSLNQLRDSLNPQLNLTGNLGSNGLAGDAVPITTPLGVSVGGSSSGFGQALHQVFAFGSPTYGFNLSLNLPLRNSSGEAQLADALVQETTHGYQQRDEAQQITQDVRLADTQLRMAVTLVQSATTARDLAQKNVDAEQQKYQLGSITAFELLQAQVQLSNVQSTLLGAYTGYQLALIAYERATWTLLDKLGLKISP